ncbi:LOB domain-containing protein [Trifolium repens]|nr:LOB domain-containing protein [Trifolium repens]
MDAIIINEWLEFEHFSPSKRDKHILSHFPPSITMSGIAREITHRCAACKQQHRRCDSSCDLAPFFPPDNQQRFRAVHEVFGRSNVSKIVREIDPTLRDNTVDSLVFEAETRLRDPINGYLTDAHNLEHRLMEIQQEITNMKSELTKYISPEVIQTVMNNPSCFGFEPRDNQNSPAQLTAAQHEQLEVLRQRINRSDTGFNFVDGDVFGQHDMINGAK